VQLLLIINVGFDTGCSISDLEASISTLKKVLKKIIFPLFSQTFH